MPIDLPPLHEGLLDPDALGRLFADLRQLADVTEVLLKGAPTGHAQPAPDDLDQAERLLLAGLVRGVQIRYRYDGKSWCDTLLRAGSHFRVVRMDVSEMPGG